MIETDTEGRAPAECDVPTGARGQPSRASQSQRVRGMAAYYRLRNVALEAQVATLQAELDRTEKRLQETIARYEEILQHRPTDDSVTTTHASSD